MELAEKIASTGYDASAEFNIRMTRDEDVNIIGLFGVLNIYTSHELKNELFELAENRDTKIVLDFAHLAGIDSAGIGSIISAMHRMRRIPGAKLIVCNLTGNVEKLFIVTRIISLFTVVRGVTEALELMRD